MKKHTIKLLTLAFTLAAILTLTGCPGPVTPDNPCTHENKKTVIETAATCTETGLEKIICADCGELIEENTIEALGHDFGKWEITENPTCTEKGSKTRKCSRCGETETVEIDALGHDWELKSDTATCTEDGEKTYKCSRCDETKTENIPALGHVDYETSGYCENCKAYKFTNQFTVRVYKSKDEFIKDSNFSSELSSNNENNNPYDECKFSFESENPSMTVDTLIHKKLRYLNYSVIAFKKKGFPTPITSIENKEIINEIYSIYIEPQTN